MKHHSLSPIPARAPLYPNAADANYFQDKALEILTGMLTGTAAVTGLLLLLTMA